ncbi:hypothetical protein HZ326_5360 [Fusarium oxysporum f. sp. albedinis]|nr:hypothetical protein HZ326_5360 [Fusarium oxysporum f. sp. albedinis]
MSWGPGVRMLFGGSPNWTAAKKAQKRPKPESVPEASTGETRRGREKRQRPKDVGVSWYPSTAKVSGVQRSRGKRSNGDFALSRVHQRERRSSPSTCELQAGPCRNFARCRKVAGKKGTHVTGQL